MIGEKYLDETMNTDGKNGITRLEPNVINLIESPTGSGKTHWVLNKLIYEFPDKKRVLYLIDSKGGNIQLVKKHDDCCFFDERFKSWELNIDEPLFFREKYIENKVVVMTYHKLAHLLNRQINSRKRMFENFDLIICDEVHNLYYYQLYNANKINLLNFAELWLNMLIDTNSNIRIVALSATPDKAYKLFSARVNPVLSKSELKNIKQYSTVRTETYLTIDNLLAGVDELISNFTKKRGIVFVHKIDTMREYAKKIKLLYPKMNIQMIWSLNTSENANENHPDKMTQEQLDIWNFILNHEVIPHDIDILFINSACETCINIRETMENSDKNYKIDYMFIETWKSDTLNQVRGRYRADLDFCAYPSNPPTYIYIPNQFLNPNKLSKKETDKLCEQINLKNKNGGLSMFPTIKKILEGTERYKVEKKKASTTYYTIQPIHKDTN